MVVIFMSSRGFSKCVVAIIFLLLIWPHVLNRLPLLTAFASNKNRGLEVLLYRVGAGGGSGAEWERLHRPPRSSLHEPSYSTNPASPMHSQIQL
jgi:hypothetical protein